VFGEVVAVDLFVVVAVHVGRDGAEVGGVDAGAVSADVVDVPAFGDFSDEEFVDDSVGDGWLAVDGDLAVAVTE
jgi:hypothetical protein